MEQVPVKVTIISSPRKRAKTWEISDSEDEEPDCSFKGDLKVEQICPQVSDHADDCVFEKAVPEELLRDQQGELDIDARGHDWTGFDVIAKTVEPSEPLKEQSNAHHPSTTSDLSLPLPRSTTLSSGKRSSKKKCPKEVEEDRAQAQRRKNEKELNDQDKERIKTLEKPELVLTIPYEASSIELSEHEKERHVHRSPTTSGLSLTPKSTTPSPTKRSRKKKSPEELEAARAQAEERKKGKAQKCQEKDKDKLLEKQEHDWTGKDKTLEKQEHDWTGKDKTLEKQEHDWTGPHEKDGSVEGSESQKEQRNVHQTPTTLLVSLPKSTSPSPVKRSRKKKSPEELEAARAQAEERKKGKAQKCQEKGKDKPLEKQEHDWTGPHEKDGSVEGSERQKEQRNVHQTPTTSGLFASLPKSTSPSPMKRSRKKKSPEELEADRAQAEERKKEKELKRLEKERIKNLEKEEREKRKESAQALKLLRPDQCGKYMIVQMDAGLLQDAGSEDVLEALRSAGYKHSIEPLSTPWSITWRREMPVGWTCVEGLELYKGEENEMLVLLEPRDFLKSVSCYIQIAENSRSSETAASMFGMDRKCPGKKITLVVLGLHDYRRYQRLSHKMERHSLEPRHFCDEQAENHVTRHHIDEVTLGGSKLLILHLRRNLARVGAQRITDWVAIGLEETDSAT